MFLIAVSISFFVFLFEIQIRIDNASTFGEIPIACKTFEAFLPAEAQAEPDEIATPCKLSEYCKS